MLKLEIFNYIILELETEIEQLRETQKKYGNILKLAKSMATQFQCFILTQVRICNCLTNILGIIKT